MSEAMKPYTIRVVTGEPDWTAVPQLEVSNILWTPDWGIRAFGQFCHDAENLYVRLRAQEQDIRAEHTAPLSMVCEDSCLEFSGTSAKSLLPPSSSNRGIVQKVSLRKASRVPWG